jgi:hypothetical protein
VDGSGARVVGGRQPVCPLRARAGARVQPITAPALALVGGSAESRHSRRRGNKRGKARSGPGVPVDVSGSDDHAGCCAVFARAGLSPSLSFSPRLCSSSPSNFSRAMFQAIVAFLESLALLSLLELLPPSCFASCYARHIRSGDRPRAWTTNGCNTVDDVSRACTPDQRLCI